MTSIERLKLFLNVMGLLRDIGIDLNFETEADIACQVLGLDGEHDE